MVSMYPNQFTGRLSRDLHLKISCLGRGSLVEFQTLHSTPNIDPYLIEIKANNKDKD